METIPDVKLDHNERHQFCEWLFDEKLKALAGGEKKAETLQEIENKLREKELWA
jgi:hypothetical protein